jgi:hypothetical protein
MKIYLNNETLDALSNSMFLFVIIKTASQINTPANHNDVRFWFPIFLMLLVREPILLQSYYRELFFLFSSFFLLVSGGHCGRDHIW